MRRKTGYLDSLPIRLLKAPPFGGLSATAAQARCVVSRALPLSRPYRGLCIMQPTGASIIDHLLLALLFWSVAVIAWI